MESVAQTFHKETHADVNSLENLKTQLLWVLRVTVALCFIGHGAWGVITKRDWLTFFHALGIGDSIAWTMMPIVGSFDILTGILILLKPRRALLLWAVFWTTFTALLRPFAGLGLWEVWERGGNYGPPLALLLLSGPVAFRMKNWFEEIRFPNFTIDRLNLVQFTLQVSLALLLIGHGGFGFYMQKQMLASQWNAIGVPATANFMTSVGLFEAALGVMVMLAPTPALLVFILSWKLFTELLYPITGPFVNIFEFIERWGDYGTPLALILIYRWKKVAGEKISALRWQ